MIVVYELMTLHMTKEELSNFISFNPSHPTQVVDYYYKAQNKIMMPNWITFLFGAYWFLYRRMYFMFFIFYFVIGYSIQYFFAKAGYDRGASGAYSSMILNTLIAFFGTALYLRFVKRKMGKVKRLGVHVRLFYPFVLFARNLFFLLILQICGIWLHIDFLIIGIYPFLLLSLGHMFIMYIYYFFDWRRSRYVI